MGHWIEIATPKGPVAGWKVDGPAVPRGAIVVLQEIFGVNAHIRSVAEDYAAQGYATLAPAFFDVVERGVELDYDAAGVARGRELIARLGLEDALAITAAAARALQPAGAVGTVGYCWGGTIALLAALRLGLPSVSYYGARNVPFLDEAPQAAVMFHFGEQDASIPPAMVERHRGSLPQMQTFTYPAGHGFNCDRRADFDAASASLARERSLAFFAERLR